jgi:hypothetical protein
VEAGLPDSTLRLSGAAWDEVWDIRRVLAVWFTLYAVAALAETKNNWIGSLWVWVRWSLKWLVPRCMRRVVGRD